MDLSEILQFDLLELDAAFSKGMAGFAAPVRMGLPKWAEKNFYLSAESSYVEQNWKPWPFQPAIMACMGSDAVEEVDVDKSARVGYTKMFLACIAYNAQHRRRNQIVWQPTDDDRDEWVKTELEPMLRDVGVMKEVFPEYLARHKNNTLKQKIFIGSTLHAKGGKAAKNFRRVSSDVGYWDEIDGFDENIENEGDSFTLGSKRMEGATFPKRIVGSTPKLAKSSLIKQRAAAAKARFQFEVPCIHCGKAHPLSWGGARERHGFKWRDNDPTTVTHQCPHCEGHITQADYLAVSDRGIWRSEEGITCEVDEDGEPLFRDASGAEIPPVDHVAFRVWTAYSPAVDWPKIVEEFLEAVKLARQGEPHKLQGFWNTTLGWAWEPKVEKTEGSALKARAENIPLRFVQLGGLVLVAGVDVQGNRWEIVVWAIGVGFQMWPVDYMVIYGNPGIESEWSKLDAYLMTRFPHAGGQRLAIDAVGIDTGGQFTHQAYEFCRVREGRRVWAVKGENQDGKPIVSRSTLVDINADGRIIKDGVRLWWIGTGTAKDVLHARLQIVQPGPGYVHFSNQLPDAFYDQITNEQRIEQVTARGKVWRWVPKADHLPREVLDCTVYAMWAAHRLDLHRYTDAMWERLRLAVCPPTADLFAPPIAGPVAVETIDPESGEVVLQPIAGQEGVPVEAASIPVQTPVRAGRRVRGGGGR